ncbi:MAG: DUF58 domain-containing protein [Planctomycetota bacterium]|jgi:uncharacterized protein (DUF58 family)
MTRRYHLNVPVLVFIVLILLIALAAMNNQNNLLFWLFGAMVALLFVSGIVSGVMMLGLRVRRLDPRHGTVGEPLVVRYRLTNRNRLFPAFNVHIEDLPSGARSVRRRRRRAAANEDDGCPEGAVSFDRLMKGSRAWVMHVGPRDTVHGEAVLWPRRRGVAQFEALRIWTTFPFGLVKKSITIRQPAHTLIYPRRYELRRRVVSAITPSGPPGMLVTPQAGAGHDYYGLREHRPGDSLRFIAWKRTANLDQLVCIERARTSPPKVRVCLNLTTAAERELEEQAISLAASMVHAVDAAGFEVGLSILGMPIAPLPVRRSQWHLGKIMAALALIDLERPRRQIGRGQLPDVERTGLVVIHPDRVDAAIGRADAWHFTARQLEQLASRPIGWDPRRNESEPAASSSEVAA